MYVSLLLDKPQGQFTNLDIVSGKVQVRLPTPQQITSITVKLEGESRTRLLSPGRPEYKEKPHPVLEVHKLLYKVLTVYDGPEMEARGNFSFLPGVYEYPFQFKLPFNNQCNANQKTGTALGLFGLSIDAPGMPMQHVKATLPPSLYFPGEAEIRYYIKVTVNRPGLLRENPRVFANLNFVPIEPPRPTTDGEMYARRQHSFKQDHYNPPSWERKNSGGLKGLFRKDSSTPTTPIPSPVSPATPSASPEPARFTIDARLPNPAVLTCGEDVPLRVIIKPLSEWNESLYLQTVHIELIGYTKVRAEDAVRVETHSWVIMSSANINQTIGNPSDAVDTEIEIPKKYWEGRPLPNTVAPSFVTCNIQRWYELVVSVGLTYGSNKERHQFISLPLRTKVEVYSGIRPPDALLKRMATAPPRPGSPTRPQRIPAPSQRPPRPVAAPAASVSSSAAAAAAQQEEPPPSYEDAPPSYEDAIASDLPPIDGPRPDYAPPPAPLGESTLGEKR